MQVTEAGGFYAEESWDGRYLFYSKAPPSGIWRRGVQGGEEIEIVPGPIPWGDWAVSRNGIYYCSAPYGGMGTLRQRGLVIHYLDFDSGQTTVIYENEEPAVTSYLAVSTDEQLLFGKTPFPKSEIYLVENIR